MAKAVSACLGNKDEQKPDVSMFTRPIVSVDSAVHNPLPPHTHIFPYPSNSSSPYSIKKVTLDVWASDSGVTDRVDCDGIESDVCLRRL